MLSHLFGDWEDAFSFVWMNQYTHLKNQLLGTRMKQGGGRWGGWIGIRDAFFPEKGFVNKAKAMQVKNEHSALGKPNYANLSTFT